MESRSLLQNCSFSTVEIVLGSTRHPVRPAVACEFSGLDWQGLTILAAAARYCEQRVHENHYNFLVLVLVCVLLSSGENPMKAARRGDHRFL